VADARSRTQEFPALAAQLDATYLVDGSVQQAGDQIRVNLSLVRPDTSIAWADSVEGPFEAILSLQTRLASALAQAVVVQLTAADRASLAQQATGSPEALGAYWRGKALLERRDIKGNLEAALASYDEAIRLDPRFADAYAARGEALWVRYSDARNSADAQAAIEANNAAVKLDPNRAEVRNALASTLAGTGKLDAAIEELHRALALRPNFEDARIQLGRVLARQGKTDEAIAEFKKVSDQRPNYAAPYTAMGSSLYEAGRYREAAAAFERVTEIQPDNVIAYQQVGVCYQSLGDDERALAFYQKALAIRPYPQAYSNIGAIYHQRGEYAKAVEAYEQAIALRPNARETHRNLGDALARLGRHPDAVAAYRRAIQLAEKDLEVNPSDMRIAASLAVYLQKAGDADRARDKIAEAEAVAPRDFEVLRRAAQVHALAGRQEAALDVLDRAIQNGFRRETAASEDELQSLRDNPRFKALVQSGRR
jgi:tetratricopeptide (TPR) repeat protein